MIFVIQDRTYVLSGHEKRAFTPYKNTQGILHAPNVKYLFQELDKALAVIPPEEQYDLHYTIADYKDPERTEFIKQDVIPLDLDKIDVNQIEKYIEVVLKVIKHERHEVAIIASGHGLHFLIGIKNIITSASYFADNKHKYLFLCGNIAAECFKAGLPVDMDDNVFRNKATLRLPGTENRKFPDAPKKSIPIQLHIESKIASLDALVEMPDVNEGVDSLRVFSTPDSKAVLSECNFLNWCKENQEEVKEPQWYAMLTILSKLEDGKQLCHHYSDQHRSYNPKDVDSKSDYALNVGPRTCKNIESMWSGCNGCKHYKKVPSPICIQGEDHISTEDTGFHFVSVKKNGELKHNPDYEGLRKYFERKHSYIVMTDSKMVYIWNGKHWDYCHDAYIENFANEHFRPQATNAMRSEFKNLVFTTNLRSSDWFDKTTEGFMNFSNGILNMKTRALSPHSTDFGFMSALEYPYDKDAKCPTFDQFMKDITVNRPGLAKVMLQFMGYAFSGEKCRLAKALIMYGGGANGKSTLMNIMKRAAGQRAYSSLSLPELQSEQNRYELIGKFFNMSEETPNRKALDSSTFKNLVSGGEFMIKVVYKTPFKHKNKTKIVLACNELPEIEDNTHGMFRRLLIVPFDACFTGKEVFDMEDKLERELPGIFNLIIDGYQQLLANGGFVIPKEVEDEVSNYRLHSDDVYYYINKHITLQPFGDRSITLNKTTFEDLYDKYSSFAEMKMHKRPVKFRNFRTTIERIMPKERIINDQIWGIEYPNQGTF